MIEMPAEWDIVIVGAWNVAILTPQGISQRLFRLGPEAPIDVAVALDGLAPIRVKHDGVIVSPSASRLVVAPEAATRERMEQAANIARRALEQLPETPVTAVGLNIRHSFESPPASLFDHQTTPLDDLLADQSREVKDKVVKRRVSRGLGVINLEIHETAAATVRVSFNFHRESGSTEDLSEWLSEAVEMHAEADQLLSVLCTEA